ncbi:hypothetical protein FN846DRAFT_647860 [Sphaerosporella brunnea]|uniref:Uncharacterized protein n=1 Tax=Sphaerosporella brunnea TaxID=1250544 RepID=A0A5J5F089_9PEZI|nr:hypothetical protein FN846DRAFT_647860 [Sphaerosporella brunnea]
MFNFLLPNRSNHRNRSESTRRRRSLGKKVGYIALESAGVALRAVRIRWVNCWNMHPDIIYLHQWPTQRRARQRARQSAMAVDTVVDTTTPRLKPAIPHFHLHHHHRPIMPPIQREEPYESIEARIQVVIGVLIERSEEKSLSSEHFSCHRSAIYTRCAEPQLALAPSSLSSQPYILQLALAPSSLSSQPYITSLFTTSVCRKEMRCSLVRRLPPILLALLACLRHCRPLFCFPVNRAEAVLVVSSRSTQSSIGGSFC